MTSLDAVTGSLLGTAVGDALGLPYEKVSPRRAARLLGPPERFRFFFGRGLTSDDTEHSCYVLESLIASQGDPTRFPRELASRLRLWLLLLPAGTGLASVKAAFKLLLGASPADSGVFSAGNGPAMRAAVLGAAIDDLAELRSLIRSSSRITHTDPKAEYGAFAVALAARYARTHASPDAQEFAAHLREELTEPDAAELHDLVAGVVASVERGQATTDYAAEKFGERGVSGYVYHTIPAALHAWFRHPHDYRRAVTQAILCGGDADTTAAVVGGIVGAGVGKAGIPPEWLAGVRDWPRSIAWMETLAQAVVDRPPKPPRLPIWGLIPRNALFLFVVLCHGYRRLLPPYRR